MLQGSWGQLRLRSSTTWRWAANFWLLVSWLKPCPTTTQLWVRLHTLTHIYAPDIFILCLCSDSALPYFLLYTLRKLHFSRKMKIQFSCRFTEGDSKNYLTFYKRAAVFLAMGKSKSALPDLTRAIQLKPDFSAVSSPDYIRGKNQGSYFCLSGLLVSCSSCPYMFVHFQARLQRGNILLKQGNTQEAREDFEAVVSSVFRFFDPLIHVVKGSLCLYTYLATALPRQ